MELKDARALSGLTQAELADAIGVHKKTIVNWETSGVPAKSEYKVRRAIPNELRYVEYRGDTENSGSLPMSFEEWMRDTIERAFDATHEEPSDQLLALEAATDAIHAAEMIERLSPFTSVQMLSEVSRRIRVLEQSVTTPRESEDVGGSDDDLHSVDLSQEELELAASTDDSVVDPDRGA